MTATFVANHLGNERAFEVDREKLPLVEWTLHEDSFVSVLAWQKDHSCNVGPKRLFYHLVDLINEFGEPDWTLLIYWLHSFSSGKSLQLSRDKSTYL